MRRAPHARGALGSKRLKCGSDRWIWFVRARFTMCWFLLMHEVAYFRYPGIHRHVGSIYQALVSTVPVHAPAGSAKQALRSGTEALG